MTTTSSHPHGNFDRYSSLIEELGRQVGTEESAAVAARIVDAERADFHWEARIAERNLGALESFDDGDERLERVAILGYFRGRSYTAMCVVDDSWRVPLDDEFSCVRERRRRRGRVPGGRVRRLASDVKRRSHTQLHKH